MTVSETTKMRRRLARMLQGRGGPPVETTEARPETRAPKPRRRKRDTPTEPDMSGDPVNAPVSSDSNEPHAGDDGD